MSKTKIPLRLIEKEVEGLHRFLEDWFNGRCALSDEELQRFSGVLAPGFRIVSADGRTTDRATAIQAVRSAHGMWSMKTDAATEGGEVRIENFESCFTTEDAAVVLYDEWHEAAGNRQGFKSTAVLQLRQGQEEAVEWLHLHQTSM